MGFLTVQKKKVNDSDLYFLTSKMEDGKHLLFLDWDTEFPRDILKTMIALGIPGIMVKAPRGHHFISSLPPMDFRITLRIQRMLKADLEWIKSNRRRGFSSLRVSIKYPNEEPLWVLGYFFEDKKLRKEYEDLVKTYFYKGQPYHSDY